MATPTTDYYGCASGGVISAGRTQLRPETAIGGDSISTILYGLSSTDWASSLSGGRAKIVAQSGRGGTGVSDWVGGVDNSYLGSPPGLSGLPQLGRIFFRLGTTDCWADRSYASLQPSYETPYAKLAG